MRLRAASRAAWRVQAHRSARAPVVGGAQSTRTACSPSAPIVVDLKSAIPIHDDDDTAFKSPPSHFKQAVAGAGLSDRVHYRERGETYAFEVSPARRQGLG